MKKSNKKIITLIVIFAILFSSFSPLFARKAEAQWVVLDPSNLVQNILKVLKDYGLDSLAWSIVNLIIERMTAATVNWINSGFQGSPAYVTDPEAYFKNMADQIAGQYIFSNPDLNALCGPISARIRLTLARNYIREPVWQCTLTDVVGNMEDFMGDFSRGGWDKFFELSQRTQNNPIGAYLQAENEMYAQIASRQGARRAELDWGGGFMSWKECEEYEVLPPGQEGPPQCIRETTNTPGSVISGQLNKQLGLGGDKLAVADEINELVSALLNQLISQVVGGIGRGLRGLSSPSPTGGSSFAELLSDRTDGDRVVDYFGNVTDASILDVPIPDPYEGRPVDSQLIWPDTGNPPFQP